MTIGGQSPKKVSSLKVLFCVSEALPFAATGGLGEVGGSLPKALREHHPSVDVRVVMPLYKVIGSDVRDKMEFVGDIRVTFGWREEYCGLYSLSDNNIIYYFVDNEKYFKRDNLYGYDDDGERFAFFSKACLEIVSLTKFKPDVLHVNEWHTALSIVYLRTQYKDVKDFAKTKTLFTLHNINYQGKFDPAMLNDVFGIDYRDKGILEWGGEINLVKAAIEACDMWSTVSTPYAEEIKTSEFGMGIENVVQRNSHKLVGIMSGIDYEYYNPKTNKELFERYDKKTLAKKAMNKAGVQKLFQMQVDPTIPMLLYNGRLTQQKGVELIMECIDDILGDRIQMIVMGNGQKKYEDFFDHVAMKYEGKFKVVRYNGSLSKKLYAAADLVLMPSAFEPCGLCQMIASRYGAVPIVRETGGLKESVRDFGCEGGGNGYTFKNYNKEDMLYSIKRGIHDFVKDGADWEAKVRTCMETDFSWKPTVNNYIALYKKTVKSGLENVKVGKPVGSSANVAIPKDAKAVTNRARVTTEVDKVGVGRASIATPIVKK